MGRRRLHFTVVLMLKTVSTQPRLRNSGTHLTANDDGLWLADELVVLDVLLDLFESCRNREHATPHELDKPAHSPPHTASTKSCTEDTHVSELPQPQRGDAVLTCRRRRQQRRNTQAHHQRRREGGKEGGIWWWWEERQSEEEATRSICGRTAAEQAGRSINRPTRRPRDEREQASEDAMAEGLTIGRVCCVR
ncbi:hypothetical protein DFP72DRAFT_902322 [Ephemerocybe angulata]|uniref:Uncharacterized protein n=1 Tax=Ephemerocybe angulata TaxID=980116 RepID=A0A8H6M4X8_9AGAR|nr:hypothetical protein DFP72DRAFT_902322 [Tulosesus angulatus]